MRADGADAPLGGARRRAVVAMLALEPGRVVSSDRLIEGVWAQPPSTAATALQGHVSQLRRVLGEDTIVTRAPGYLLDVDAQAVDVSRCETLLERGRHELAAGAAQAAAERFEEALALWRGEPLADVGDAPFAQLALPVLRELRIELDEERFEAKLALGRNADVIAGLRALVAAEPLRERPRAQLMRGLHAAGRRAEALDVYEQGRQILSEELGIEPGERLRELHAAMLHDQGRRSLPMPRRRAGPAVAVAVAVAAAAILGVALGTGGGAKTTTARAVANGVVRVGPGGNRDRAVALDGTPAAVAASGGRAWVLDADGQTISEVGGARPRVFATGATPIDLVAADGMLWVVQGHQAAAQFTGAVPASVAEVDPSSGAVLRAVRLPRAAGALSTTQGPRIAASAGAIWVIGPSGDLVRIDPRHGTVAKVLSLNAVAVAADAAGAWAVTADGSLVRVAERGSRVGVPVDLGATNPAALAAGGGAAWVLDPATGVVERFAEGGSREPIDVGAGAGAIAYGAGSVWVSRPTAGSVVRIDTATRRVAEAIPIGGTPRALAPDGDSLWVSVSAPRATATACGHVEHPPGVAPGLVVAVDLPLRSGGRSPITAMVSAIRGQFAARGYRAGRRSVGLMVCDDSTTQRGSWDAEKCRANARADVADRRVVAVIGPYNSGCAAQQIPVAASASGGPLALVSPTTTDPKLIRPNTRRGAYVRLLADDDRVARGAARFLRGEGRRRVLVLDDGEGFGLTLAGYFAAAARGAGLNVVGRVTWRGPHQIAHVVRAARHLSPDVVFVSGLLDEGAGEVVRALHRALGPDAVIAGNDGLLPVARLFDRAGAAARGTVIATAIQPTRSGEHPFAAAAAQAAAVVLDAIAHSDGTRRSVARAINANPLFDARGDRRDAPVAILRARRAGGSRTNMALDGATLVTLVR